MKKIVTYIFLIILLVLQSSLCKNIEVLHIMPNLILVFVVCYSMYSEPVMATILGIVSGILMDVFQAQNMGFNSIVIMYIALSLSCMTSGYIRSNIWTVIVFVALSTIVYEGLYTFLTLFLFGRMSIFQLFADILIESVYNIVIAIPLSFFAKYLGEDEVRSF